MTRVDRETSVGECDGNAKSLAGKISILGGQDLDADGGVDVLGVHHYAEVERWTTIREILQV